MRAKHESLGEKQFRILHNEELCGLQAYGSSNMFKSVKSTSLQKVGHAAGMEDNSNAYIVLQVWGSEAWKRNGRTTWTQTAGKHISSRKALRTWGPWCAFRYNSTKPSVPHPGTELHQALLRVTWLVNAHLLRHTDWAATLSVAGGGVDSGESTCYPHSRQIVHFIDSLSPQASPSSSIVRRLVPRLSVQRDFLSTLIQANLSLCLSTKPRRNTAFVHRVLMSL
jgi:hypothetical protein